jgi:hypothetical protein
MRRDRALRADIAFAADDLPQPLAGKFCDDTE